MSSTCFEPEVSCSGRRLSIQVWYVTFYMLKLLHVVLYHIAAFKTYHTIIAYTTVIQKMNPRFRNT
jgi:hypothetical protein